MTKPVVCHKGKCEYEEKEALDECIDCDLIEQIEHDLMKDAKFGGKADDKHK